MSNATILIVEDDPHMLELLSLHVESAGYPVLKAENGRAALGVLENNNLDLGAIISDVEMPELDGYALCEQVREREGLLEVPFVFVSAKRTLEEMLKGFEVGGDDYITKPVEGEEVVLKVRHIIDNRIRHLDLGKQLTESRNAAMQAISYTGNLGQVLQFMQSTAEVKEFDVLADKLFAVTEALGLSVVVQFLTPRGIMNYRQSGEVTPLEVNVIELARSKGRIFDFEARTIFNYKDFSLLVLNMPISDQERYGLMKDVLGNLCDAVDSRIRLLASNVVVRQKDEVISTVTQALQSIDRSYRDIQEANLAAIDETIHRMEEAMYGFGLSESQEDTVRGIILYVKTKTAEIFEDGKELYDEFDKIKQVLSQG